MHYIIIGTNDTRLPNSKVSFIKIKYITLYV